MRDGNGSETWPEGNSYTGSYTNNEKHGKGKFSWNDGKVYEGDFV